MAWCCGSAPRRRLLAPAVAFASVFLAHCAAPTRTGDPIAGLRDIEGAWDIASFDGYRPPRLDPDGARDAFVDITADGWCSFSIGCNYSSMRGEIDNLGRLVEVPGDYVVTAMGCGDERERRDEVFFGFFRTRPTIVRAGDDLILRSGGTRLVLQRPAVRRVDALPTSIESLYGRWSAHIVYFEVEPGNSRNLIALMEGEPAVFHVSAGAVTLAFDCERVASRVRLEAPGSLEFVPAQRSISTPCRLPQSDRDLAASLLSGAAEVERIDPSRLHLVAGRVRAVLEREEG